MTVVADIDPTDPSKIIITSEYAQRELIKEIPGSSWERERGVWRIPLGWSGCLALRSAFGSDLVIGDRLNAWARHERDTRVDPALLVRESLSAPGDADLYPYQRADVSFLLSARAALLGNEPGTGKAQPVDEPVITPGGWRPIGSLRPGDYVMAPDGLPTEVLATHPQGLRPVYEVVLSDGSRTRADAEHLWTVQTHNDRVRGTTRTITTEDIRTALLRGGDPARIHVPVHAPMEFAWADLPIDPYLLGYMLGDGSLSGSGARVTIHDQESIDRLSSIAVLRRHKDGVTYSIDGLTTALSNIGLMGVRAETKHIPPEYLLASVEQRRALLAGLVDTDGTVDHGLAEYTTVSHRLAADVASLARSLGYVVRISKPSIKSFTYLGERRKGQPSQRVRISPHSGAPNPFRLSRKAALWQKDSRWRAPARRIVEVRYLGELESVCIEVDHHDHLYMTNDYIPTHNTAAAIRTVMHAYADGESVFPILVVCPNSVKHTWRREIAKWWPGCVVQVVSGTAAQRRKQLASNAHFYVINWEALRTHSRLAPYGSIALKRCRACGGHDDSVTDGRCEVHQRELNTMSFGAIIADEAHRMKDPKSKMSRALWALSDGSDRRIAMTGTPIANNVGDLWSILHWLSPEEWPGKSKWLERNCNIYYDAWGGIVISGIKPDRQEEFDASFLPRFRRVPKSAVLTDLPPVVSERRDVPMSPKQKKAYEAMRDDLIAEVDGGVLVAASVLTRTGRLVQLASAYGEMVVDDEKDTEKFVLGDPSSKVDAFMDDIADFGDQSVVVMAVSKQLINLLSAKMTAARIPHGLITGDQDEYERDVAVEDFQAGRTKFILCTIQAGGVGLTLTAGSIMAFLQRSWSAVDMEQAKNRCHRPGAEKHDSILIIDYVAPGTIEEAVIAALDGKGEQLENLVRDKDALRRMLTGEME